MKKQVISFLFVGIFLSILSFGQNKVLLVNGSSISSTSINIENEFVKLNVNGETRTVTKKEVLCIIPARGKSYTFSQRSNKKVKIASKDLKNNFYGTDKARLFAYKYYKTKPDVNQLYILNSDQSVSIEEFEATFFRQNQQIRTRVTVSTVLSVALLVISVGMLSRTLKDVNSLSYNGVNHLPGQGLKTNSVSFNSNFNLAYNKCIC